jgi:hypothetical protein
MVHRWRCRHCAFTVWSASREPLNERIGAHLLDHHRERLTKRDFRTTWECPYCTQSGESHDGQAGVARFKDHLFEHGEPLVESDTHVAEEIDGTGNVLVRSPLNATGANNARMHFLTPGDIVLFVTTTPGERIRLLKDELQSWPAWTVILTTKEYPLEGVDNVELADAPLEVVRLDRRLGLSDLGETVSRVLDEQKRKSGKLSVEFDILSEIIEKFETQTVFKFLHLLTRRLESVGALSHFYVDPRAESASTINVLEQLFDLSLTADERTFTTGGT